MASRILGLLPAPTILAIFALFEECRAGRSLQNVTSDSHREGTGMSGVLHYATFMLMALSTALLLVCMWATLQMPRPSCCCYTVNYSDAAVCYGTPCCSCANIRQANAVMILIWNVLLMCELAMGLDLLFIYAFLAFCLMHGLIFLIVHMLVRSYRRQNLLPGDGSHTHQLRSTQRAGGGAAATTLGAASSPGSPPPIHTMSAELVLVLQPDYLCYNDGLGELQRSSNCTAGGVGDCGGGGGGNPTAVQSPPRGAPRGTVAWALRYTRTNSMTAAAAGGKPCNAAKLAAPLSQSPPPPPSPPSLGMHVGMLGRSSLQQAATAATTAATTAAATAAAATAAGIAVPAGDGTPRAAALAADSRAYGSGEAERDETAAAAAAVALAAAAAAASVTEAPCPAAPSPAAGLWRSCSSGGSPSATRPGLPSAASMPPPTPPEPPGGAGAAVTPAGGGSGAGARTGAVGGLASPRAMNGGSRGSSSSISPRLTSCTRTRSAGLLAQSAGGGAASGGRASGGGAGSGGIGAGGGGRGVRGDEGGYGGAAGGGDSTGGPLGGSGGVPARASEGRAMRGVSRQLSYGGFSRGR